MNAAVEIVASRKIYPTPGGVHPPDNKEQSLTLPLEDIAQPPEVILPLNQHIGAKAEPLVKVGDTVLKGQLVACAKGYVSANVHASVSGTVIAIEARPIAHPSGMSDTCIVIRNNMLDQWCEIIPCANYRQLHAVEIVDRIQAAGIVGMGGAGFPTAVKLQSKQKINTLIVNATECEPYITADDILMRTDSDHVVAAIAMLDHLLEEPQEILIAIEDNKPEAIAHMQAAVKQSGNPRIEIAVLPTKYPSGGEKQLIQMLTGKEVASGQLPASLGIVCQNIATVVAAYDAVVKGIPLISRIVTLSGAALEKQQNLRIPIGTPIEFILRQQGLQSQTLARLVMGGPMMGFTLTDTQVPVVKTTNCILALSREESPPPQPAMPCIRCGMCAEACPASLLPQQLYWYARAQDHEKLTAYHLSDCIECGACSYACPSHIPLVQYYRSAKAEIRQAEFDKQQSDRARERFEFHKQRIEAEKEARAEAKRLATEKAKQRKQEQTPDVEPEVKLVDKDEAEDFAKLERNLATANDRLQKLMAKLDTVEKEAPEQAPALQARIKETEFKIKSLAVRVDKAKKKRNINDSEVIENIASETVEQTDVSDQGVSTSEQQLGHWQQQLANIQHQIANTNAEEQEAVAALKLSEQILQSKINRAVVDASNAAVDIKGGAVEDGSDALQRAMENAMSKTNSPNHN